MCQQTCFINPLHFSNPLAKYVLQDRVLLRWPNSPQPQMKAKGSADYIGINWKFSFKIYGALKTHFQLSGVGTGNMHCLKRYVGNNLVTFDWTEFFVVFLKSRLLEIKLA